MWKLEFWKETAERALKSAAQGMLTLFTLEQSGVVKFDTTWEALWLAAVYGAGYSLLTSIVSAPIGRGNSPNLLK